MEIMAANRQWATRPADERFTSLHALAAFTNFQKKNSKRTTLPNRDLTVVPSTTDQFDIAVSGPNGHPAQLSNWSFGQLCSLAGVPADYIKRSNLPGALAADNLNWGLHHHRKPESVNVLLRRNEDKAVTSAAFNGPDYGTVWNADISNTLVEHFDDGISGDWRVPGEFGKAVTVTKENTTIYASDRDMWVFLADEENRIEIPNRRDNKTGSLARGFYIGNSEVGASSLTLGMFLFDYVCCNRIIWGAQQFERIKIRHTASAPNRWLEEIKPLLNQLRNSPAAPIVDTIKAAQQQKLKTDVASFLETRFGTSAAIIKAHEIEEQRPIETLFDVVTAATAYSKTLSHQDARIKVERIAGDILQKLAPSKLSVVAY